MVKAEKFGAAIANGRLLPPRSEASLDLAVAGHEMNRHFPESLAQGLSLGSFWIPKTPALQMSNQKSQV